VNKTLHNLINDCNNKIHFSKNFFEVFSNEFNDELILIITNLNENIYNQFLRTIKIFNISSELHLLHNLAGLTDIRNLQNNFNQIDQIFTQIIQQNSQLPNQFLTETLNEVKTK
jgi:hypothetical protein